MKHSLFTFLSIGFFLLFIPAVVFAQSYTCMTPTSQSNFCPIPYLAASKSSCVPGCGSTQNCCQAATCNAGCTVYDGAPSSVQGCPVGKQVDPNGECGGGTVCCMPAPISTPTATIVPNSNPPTPTTIPVATPTPTVPGGQTSPAASLNACNDPSLNGTVAVCADGGTNEYPTNTGLHCTNSSEYYCFVNILHLSTGS